MIFLFFLFFGLYFCLCFYSGWWMNCAATVSWIIVNWFCSSWCFLGTTLPMTHRKKHLVVTAYIYAMGNEQNTNLLLKIIHFVVRQEIFVIFLTLMSQSISQNQDESSSDSGSSWACCCCVFLFVCVCECVGRSVWTERRPSATESLAESTARRRTDQSYASVVKGLNVAHWEQRSITKGSLLVTLNELPISARRNIKGK